jgi:hypothetical protein
MDTDAEKERLKGGWVPVLDLSLLDNASVSMVRALDLSFSTCILDEC